MNQEQPTAREVLCDLIGLDSKSSDEDIDAKYHDALTALGEKIASNVQNNGVSTSLNSNDFHLLRSQRRLESAYEKFVRERQEEAEVAESVGLINNQFQSKFRRMIGAGHGASPPEIMEAYNATLDRLKSEPLGSADSNRKMEFLQNYYEEVYPTLLSRPGESKGSSLWSDRLEPPNTDGPKTTRSF